MFPIGTTVQFTLERRDKTAVSMAIKNTLFQPDRVEFINHKPYVGVNTVSKHLYLKLVKQMDWRSILQRNPSLDWKDALTQDSINFWNILTPITVQNAETQMVFQTAVFALMMINTDNLSGDFIYDRNTSKRKAQEKRKQLGDKWKRAATMQYPEHKVLWTNVAEALLNPESVGLTDLMQQKKISVGGIAKRVKARAQQREIGGIARRVKERADKKVKPKAKKPKAKKPKVKPKAKAEPKEESPKRRGKYWTRRKRRPKKKLFEAFNELKF